MPLRFTLPEQIQAFWVLQQAHCPWTDIFSDNLHMVFPYKGAKVGCWVNTNRGKECRATKDYDKLGMPWLGEVCLVKFWKGREKIHRPIYNYLNPPKITWVDPRNLVPHEPVSPPHLSHLIKYLKHLPEPTLLPTIIVTKSTPHVILDGHHRHQASLAMNISRVPVWIVDDTVADDEDFILPVPLSQYKNITELKSLQFDDTHLFKETYEFYKVRVYETRNYNVLRIQDIATKAREAQTLRLLGEEGSVDAIFGVKGTKHVAIRLPSSGSHVINVYGNGLVLGLGDKSLNSNSNAKRSSWTGGSGSGNIERTRLNGVEEEIRLENVAPRVEWGLWKAGGQERVRKEQFLEGAELGISKILVNSRSDSIVVVE